MSRNCRMLLALSAASWIAAIDAPSVRAESKRLQVYILAGQSNMQGHAQVRTIDAMRLNPRTVELRREMLNDDGSPRVCNRVWISSLGSADEVRTGRLTAGFGAEGGGPKIGPEFTFGLTLEKSVDAPILIIKTAWGGKSLNTDFRPPSAGPYVFNETQLKQIREQGKDLEAIQAEKAAATGVYYRLMIEQVRQVLNDIPSVCPEYDAQQGYELAGFVWFQGWNDMVDQGTYPRRDQPGGYDAYSEALAHFIRDVRRDLSAPSLPFVIGVLGVGGPVDQYLPDQIRYRTTHQVFRDAMAAPAKLPEFQGNVVAVLTETCWDQEVTRLRARERSLKPALDEIAAAAKAKALTAEAAEAARNKLYAEQFNERELMILRESVSNAEYHYLGSAGILGLIGQSFAEALLALQAK